MEPKYTVDITLDENDIKRFAKMLQGDQKKGYIFTAVAVLATSSLSCFMMITLRPEVKKAREVTNTQSFTT